MKIGRGVNGPLQSIRPTYVPLTLKTTTSPSCGSNDLKNKRKDDSEESSHIKLHPYRRGTEDTERDTSSTLHIIKEDSPLC